MRQLDKPADGVHQPHLLDRLAVGVEEARGAHEHDAALGARGGDVDAVAVEGEADAARSVFHTLEADESPLTGLTPL